MKLMKLMAKPFVLLCALLLLLTSCDSKNTDDVGKKVSEAVEKNVNENVAKQVSGLVGEINAEVLSEVRKKYPLPDPVTIRNAHNDDVNVTTSLTVEKTAEFYRHAYSEKSFKEAEGSVVTPDSAKLAFRDPGDGKAIHIQIEKRDAETNIHLEKY